MYVTRIAPSPTGLMHVGTARTALFNWLAARASGGRFILRLDDTDVDRNDRAVVQPILDGLAWLGLDYDDYVRQGDRATTYAAHADALLADGRATRADNGAILLRWSDSMPRSWRDRVGGDMDVTDDMVGKIDGMPLVRGGERAGQATYQFASTLDDYLMDVNLVVRGTDHIANTGKQVALWSALSGSFGPKPVPEFAHVGLVFKDGKKLSKRDGAASLLEYRDAGVHPDAMFNFLLRMGWGPKVDDKSMTLIDRRTALRVFLDGGNMRAPSAGLDPVKLAFFDRRYKQLAWRAARNGTDGPSPVSPGS